MFVVIEWNQASGRPSLRSDEVYDTLADARDDAHTAREEAGSIGRRERYTVHEVDVEPLAASGDDQ